MGRPRITNAHRRAALGHRHRLDPELRTNDVAQIATDVVALHATDPATVFLSAAIRMEAPTIAAIERAMYEERSLLRHHAMRRTMWVATPAMTQITNAAVTRKIAARERTQTLKYLAQTPGINDPDEALENATEQFVAVIAEGGAASTRAVGKRAPELTFKMTVGSGSFTADVGAHTRLGALAAFEARLIRTRPAKSWVSTEYAWELMERWTDVDFTEPETVPATASLVEAWLKRFGPGTERDLTWWTGSTKTAVRSALDTIGAIEVDLEDGTTGWLAADDPMLESTATDLDTNPWIALLPSLDPTVMGWKDREWYLDEAYVPRVFDRNGNAGPTIWADGRVVGGWVQRSDGTLALDLLEDLTSAQQGALDTEVERVRTFIGETRFRVRFPSPNQKELLA